MESLTQKIVSYFSENSFYWGEKHRFSDGRYSNMKRIDHLTQTTWYEPKPDILYCLIDPLDGDWFKSSMFDNGIQEIREVMKKFGVTTKVIPVMLEGVKDGN